jgi:hypothetical protein
MSDIPVKIVVDLSKPQGQRESIIPLTPEEIAQRAIEAEAAELQRLEQGELDLALANLKASAIAKLVSGTKLTEAEAKTLVI